MAVVDAEGVTHQYFLKARSLRLAKRQARAWVGRTEWAAGLVWVRPAGQHGRARRLLRVAGVTALVSGFTIGAAMIVGLSVEGAL